MTIFITALATGIIAADATSVPVPVHTNHFTPYWIHPPVCTGPTVFGRTTTIPTRLGITTIIPTVILPTIIIPTVLGRTTVVPVSFNRRRGGLEKEKKQSKAD
jgi:hypothetical protein